MTPGPTAEQLHIDHVRGIVAAAVAPDRCACGARVWWVGPPRARTPVEQDDSATYPGCDGVVWDHRAQAIRWVSDLLFLPTRANLVHRCTTPPTRGVDTDSTSAVVR